MKKIMGVFLVLLLLSACGNDTQNINYETTPNPNTIPQGNYLEPKVSKSYGFFATKITDKTTGRLNNIVLGCSKLNGATIKPGETFSFNERTGDRTEDAGYQEAIIFDGNGNKEKGIGGGVCQISTTLYNAALDAGLEIVERHEHSRDVPYIPDGMDACVSYPSEDLKFKNTKNATLTIKATVANDKINISIEE